MADEGQVIRGINWRLTFPFTNIFRSFRIAIHPTKLVLGLALLLTVYFGGKILDGLWPAHARAVPNEVMQYQAQFAGRSREEFLTWRRDIQQQQEAGYAQMLRENKIVQPETGEAAAVFEDRLQAEAAAHHYSHETKQAIEQQRDAEVENIDANPDLSPAQRDAAVADAFTRANARMQQINDLEGAGLFDMFFTYEVHQINDIVAAVMRNAWVEPDGVIDHVYDFFAVGPIWLIWYHTVFFILFAALFLFAWSLFGGAIARIAAVQVARDEKISIRQAMNFAVGKLLSYASAPVIPLLIVIVLGLLVSAGALLGNIPYAGPIVIGASFILALLAGFVMSLVLLGTAGGFNLMYPTIAVEGSDSFDAISRSFSYIYARPWRMLFYTAVAIAYGAITYMFVHLFIWLMLVLTHHFVGLAWVSHAKNHADLLSTMWPNPSVTGRLSYSVDYSALNGAQSIGAALLWCWVMLLVAFLGAFAISLYFSANTLIYFLMRSEVDATEMDDVYLEQSEDDLDAIPAVPPPGTTVEVVTVTTTTTEAPPPTATPSAEPPPAT